MFRTWLENNRLEDFDFSHRLFPSASNRDYWESIAGKDLITAGEQYLGYEWPMIRATQYLAYQDGGDRLAQETPHFARRKALLNLFLAEIAEYKGRFLPDICDGILAICEESFWGVSAHLYDKKHFPASARTEKNIVIDLFSGETASLLSIILCVLKDELEAFFPGICDAVEHELHTRIVQPYLTNREHRWIKGWGKPNNWNPWIISNICTAFLVCPMPKEDFYRGLELMFREINLYYDVQPADGGCEEGASYWMVAGVMLHEFCHRLYVASDGKVDLYGDALLRKIGLYETSVYIGGCQFACFGDGSTVLMDASAPATTFMFGKLLGEQSLCSLAATWKKAQENTGVLQDRGTRAWREMWTVICRKELAEQSDFVPESSYVLPTLENAFMRSGSWYYAVRGAKTGRSHGHNDVASFMVYEADKPVLIDPGVGTYTKQTFSWPGRYDIWTMQTGWHNLISVNGVEQQYDEINGADRFETDGTHTAISFAKSYAPEAGLKTVVRDLYVNDTGVTLRDCFAFTASQNNVTENFITLLKPEITDSGIVLGGQYILHTDVNHQVSVDYQSFEGDSRLVNQWNAEGLYRIRMQIPCGEEATVKITLGKIE